jgi:hypothetical protein
LLWEVLIVVSRVRILPPPFTLVVGGFISLSHRERGKYEDAALFVTAVVKCTS